MLAPPLTDRILDLGELLRQVLVIPADDAILDEPFAGLGHLLVFFLSLQKFSRAADRDGASEAVHMLNAVENFLDRHAQHRLVDVAQDEQTLEEMARGELMRFFAEAAWYPTALLPNQGVRREAVDDTSAHATLTDGPLTLKLLFRFNAEGLIDTVRAEARERVVDGKTVTAPWQGRYWRYATQGGMRVPQEGEVAWLLPEGEKPYWRGRTLSASYAFANPPLQ